MRVLMMNFIRSVLIEHKSVVVAVTALTAYVEYKDWSRYRRIARVFRCGRVGSDHKHGVVAARLWKTLDERSSRRHNAAVSSHEEKLFKREEVENQLQEPLGPEFTNRYYVIRGEVGTGKSRIVKELTKRAIRDVRASSRCGAPVYIQAGHGSNFADNLASCVDFEFDEHMNIKFLLSVLLQIQQLPDKTPQARLHRTLEAIEQACKHNRDRYGIASVLVIDGVDVLCDDTVREIQRKAKIWADSNFCKVVLVTCEERISDILLENTSSWSRAADPVCIEDLSYTEAMALLCDVSNAAAAACDVVMDEKYAEKVYDLVGGRLNHLLACKRDFERSVPLHVTIEKLMAKERGKFVRIAQQPEMWSAIEIVREHRESTLLLGQLVRATSQPTVAQLAALDIIRFVSGRHGVQVKFQSPLLAKTIDVFCSEQNTPHKT